MIQETSLFARPTPSRAKELREIPLTKGFVAIIDAGDFDLIRHKKWRVADCSARHTTLMYAYTTMCRSDGFERPKNMSMHRLLLGDPRGDVDHINGNGLDNRRCNLRVCTRKENSRRARTSLAKKFSRFKGVSFDMRRGMWRAQINLMIPGRRENRFLGTFEREEDAAKEYDFAAKAAWGCFARPNFFGE